MNLSAMNRRLASRFGDGVFATLEGDVVRLFGSLERWDDVVAAGQLAARRGYYVVNDIKCSQAPPTPMRVPQLRDDALEGQRPDVLVIGGGVVGCAILRELSRYSLDALLIEKEYDVALHASSRNDGMVHPGVDLKRGQQKKRFVDMANPMFDTLCSQLGVPFKRCGQYLCFKKWYMLPILYLTLGRWRRLGVPARVVPRLSAVEPGVQDGKCALFYPTAGVLSPYELVIAYAENAIQNGARVSLNTVALSAEVSNNAVVSVETNRGTVYPRVVINAAGTFSDVVAEMCGDRFYSIHPRSGTNLIMDKKSAHMVGTIVSTIAKTRKSAHTKGGGVVRTADGNLLVGPNAAETPFREDFSTDRRVVAEVLSRQRGVVPSLSASDVITCFTGIRAATYEEDFVVGWGRKTTNLIHAAGIQSPGLTAAPAIGLHVAQLAAKRLGAAEKPSFNPVRQPIPRPSEMSEEARGALISRDPSYGVIVCRCEEISLGEVRDALCRPLPCNTTDGVKRRVRAGMGRCQGGFCSPLVARMIAKQHGVPLSEVCKNAAPLLSPSSPNSSSSSPTHGGDANV